MGICERFEVRCATLDDFGVANSYRGDAASMELESKRLELRKRKN